jgi:peptidoglycan/LPS O-acetylase OafA/YrhL
MYWQGLATVSTFGSYGVYMFFVLSGASLAYNYEGKLGTPRSVGAFLAVRWLRLAPLYLVLCVLWVAMLSVRRGDWVDLLPLRFAMNATFAFGVWDPVVWALLTGGWSLGIEFVYYLAFPLLLWVVPRKGWCVAAAIALTALQWWWIVRTVGSPEGYAASAVAYHQVPAFAAYFFGGCVIGNWRRRASFALPGLAGAGLWIAMALLLLVLNPAEPGDELLGARGAVLFAACFWIVWASGHVIVRGAWEPVAKWLGDITYGCYLLHPILFWGFAWFVLPRLTGTPVEQLDATVRIAILLATLALSCAIAALSERGFESPVRRWAKGILAPRRMRSEEQTTVPADVRASMDAKPGTRLVWSVMPDGTTIVRAKSKSILDMAGMVKSRKTKRVPVDDMNPWR